MAKFSMTFSRSPVGPAYVLYDFEHFEAAKFEARAACNDSPPGATAVVRRHYEDGTSQVVYGYQVMPDGFVSSHG